MVTQLTMCGYLTENRS